jgi:hypothetical protein
LSAESWWGGIVKNLTMMFHVVISSFSLSFLIQNVYFNIFLQDDVITAGNLPGKAAIRNYGWIRLLIY